MRARLTGCIGLIALALAPAVTHAAPRAPDGSPEIRLSTSNRVPACVTPDRLTAFLKSRNPSFDAARYADIAKFYKHYGEAWRVRWDYAAFQMIVETNALAFRRGNGDPGDVRPKQNNFAGIGTTGGGVPGDAFPDVKTGVLAHIQHLVAYSGEKLAAPVAPRTQLKQADIVEASLRINRPVRFADLARRWAVDPRYWRSIEAIADSYRSNYCAGPDPVEAKAEPDKPITPPRPTPARRPVAKAAEQPKVVTAALPATLPALAQAGQSHGQSASVSSPREPSCTVATASYGGSKTLLIKATSGTGVTFTALSVLDGFEDTMAQSFIRAHAPGGASLGAFPSRDDALAKARALCAGGA